MKFALSTCSVIVCVGAIATKHYELVCIATLLNAILSCHNEFIRRKIK